MAKRKRKNPVNAFVADVEEYAGIAAVGLIGLVLGIPVGQYFAPEAPPAPKIPKPAKPVEPEKSPADANVIDAEWEDVT
jgi:hypothetical protein